MSERIVLKNIPVEFTKEEITAVLGRRAGKLNLDDFLPLLNRVAKPKALLYWTDCEVLDDQHVIVGGAEFESVVLADKLKGLHRAFLYVFTAGNEIKECTEIQSESLKDLLSGAVLRYGFKYVHNYLRETMDIPEVSALNPGSLPDWPIQNNHAVCNTIGHVDEIGVTLNEQGYMLPWNSTSGILFTGSAGYQNCSLCTKFSCVGRRAKFNRKEYIRLFQKEPVETK